MEGFIKLSRKLLDWGWYSDGNTMRVFLDILLNANYKDGEYRGHKVKAGQCVIGRKALARKLGISEQSVRTALEHLKSTNAITIRTTNKFSVATIENWAKYQCDKEPSNQQDNQQSTNNQPTTNQQLTTSKKGRKKEGKNTTTIGFRPPTLEEVMAYKAAKNLDYVDAEYFFQYYDSDNWLKGNSRNGKKEPMRNWKQTMITWDKRERDKHQQPKRGDDGLDLLFGGKA